SALQEEGFHVWPVMRVTDPSVTLSHGGKAASRYVDVALAWLKGRVDQLSSLPEDQTGAEFQDVLGNPTGPEILIFDQFEEILTADPTDLTAKAEFFRQVGAALRNRQRWALFSMREDYVPALDP